MAPLKYDIELIKMSSGLAPSTNACKVVFGSDRTDIAALGGTAMAFFNFQAMKITNFNTDKKLHIEWPTKKKIFKTVNTFLTKQILMLLE